MAAKKKAAKTRSARRKAAKRELIDIGTNKLFVRRNKRGTEIAMQWPDWRQPQKIEEKMLESGQASA